MIKLTSIFFVLALSAGILISGCGGGDSTLSKSEYIQQADAICKKSNEAENREGHEYARKHARSLEKMQFEVARAKVRINVALPAVLKETKELKALEAPKGDEKEIEAFLAGIEEAVEKAENDLKSVEDDARNPFNPVTKMAQKYGFKDCQEVL
ncbi:MAG TPA: hypothetical protein VGO13_07275 [Solirubrobacterales bacterium]|jgi:hypothetical protein|nr:hypothetical protein [Solirubrobacterales bacterium]